VLATVDADALSFIDNEFYLFPFEPVVDCGGKAYSFSIELRPAAGSQLTLWRSATCDEEMGPCSRDGQRQEGTLAFKLYAISPSWRRPPAATLASTGQLATDSLD
jgi:hypothetical protein